MIAVSACLIGNNTKYDGTNNYNQYVIDYLKDKEYIVICPEVLGGLPTPRIPSEQKDGKVLSKTGIDVTKEFTSGALKALQMIIKNNVTELILKERSPSCGYKRIYDGSFSKNLIDGNGVFVEMVLNENKNIKIYTESDIKKMFEN